MSKTSISWAEHSWNPIVGCTKVSAGCKNCYAEKRHKRLTAMGQAKYSEPFRTVREWPAHLDIPLRRKKPTTYFVNSMGDLFHEDVSDEYIAAVFGVMASCPQHTFQLLTKRAERQPRWFEWVTSRPLPLHAAHLSADGYRGAESTCYIASERHGIVFGTRITPAYQWSLPNVWIGVSVENFDHLDRIDYLRRTPAAVRFLSLEPMLGPLEGLDLTGISWVICGGESGPGARPCDVAWIRSIIRQCREAGVACFVKQLGAKVAGRSCEHGRAGETCRFLDPKGGDPAEWPEDLQVREMP